MTSPVRTKQTFETFVMTGDTIIKTRSISPQVRSSQASLHNDSSKDSRLKSDATSNTSCNDYVTCHDKTTVTDKDSVVQLNCYNISKIRSSNNVELDIPPDDISSEDEFYKEESVVDVDHLPPPPDDFLVEPILNLTSNEDKSNSVHKIILFDETLAQSQLSRHRSYDSITMEGKNQESDKMLTSHNTPDIVDLMKISVRNYKSHDNYLQLENNVEFVPIVFDETGAISIDALNYNKMDIPHNTRHNHSMGQDLQSLPNNLQNYDLAADNEIESNGDKESPNDVIDSIINLENPSADASFQSNSLTINSKDADLPSAQRLAKRLFALDGFQQVDVAKHLGKKDSFSALVGQEYLKHFDFKNQKLDVALRNFLDNLILVGETQERERVLAHFSQRYVECNKDFALSQDSCHTVICAMMLLNIDHHSQNIARKMTLDEFLENLSALNDGKDFPEHLLKEMYHSVCSEPFRCPPDGLISEIMDDSINSPVIGTNPFLSAPDEKKAREYKRGFVMRKCCVDPDGHKTSLGKRGWRMFYATLKDLILYLHKDEHGMKRNSSSEYQNHHNSLRIHHALAEKADDYLKKQHVFRLTTSDSAQFLFQTSDNAECQSWINCINFVAATLSSAPLPSGVGSQKKFQRPLMPSSHTKLNHMEQLKKLRSCLTMLEKELEDHRTCPPDKGSKSRQFNEYVDKEHFLTFEVKRFKVYCSLLLIYVLPVQSPANDSKSNATLHDVLEEINPNNTN